MAEVGLYSRHGSAEIWPKARDAKLNGGSTALLIPDTNRIIDLGEENLTIANLAGGGRLDHCLNRPLNEIVGENHLDFDFRYQVDAVLSDAIVLCMTLLASMATHLRNRHTFSTPFRQRLFNCVELIGLNDCFKFCHDSYYSS